MKLPETSTPLTPGIPGTPAAREPTRSRRAVRWLHGIPLLWLALAAACSAEQAPTKVHLSHLTSILDGEAGWVVEEGGEERPIQFQLITPRKKVLDTLSALCLSPPARVSFELPAFPSGARLRLKAGVHNAEFDGELGSRRILFETLLDGEVVFRSEQEISAAVPEPARTWTEADLPIGAARTLSLRTTQLAGPRRPMQAGFANLDVVLPRTTERAPASPSAPNVILIVIDTLRADRLTPYGHDQPTSPNIGALAEGGLLFEHAYAPTSWTVPSTAALLTGLEPPEQPAYARGHIRLDAGALTLPEVFQAAGLATAGFSCNPLVSGSSNLDQGFDHFEANSGERMQTIFPRVADWIAAQGELRFFLYLHLFEPHSPLQPDEDLLEAFGARPFEAHEKSKAQEQVRRAHRGRPHDADYLADYFARSLRLYDAEIASVDRQLGRLMQLLRERGLAANTIVALTSDHGEEFGEHGMSGHAKQLHEESIHVPLLLSGPGLPRGERAQARVSLVDLPGTLLDLAGLAPTLGERGLDLMEVHAGGAERDSPMFFSTHLGQAFHPDSGRLLPQGSLYAVQLGDLRYMWFGFDGSDPEAGFDSLFDLGSDPEELLPLGDESARQKEQLRREIIDWLDACEARVSSHASNARDMRDIMESLGYTGD